MKIVFAILILYFSVNLISSIQWYYFPLNQETKSTNKLSNHYNSSSHLERFLFQRRNQRRPSNGPHHEVIVVSSKNYTSRWLPKNFTSRYKYSFNNTSFAHFKVNNTTKKDDRIYHRQSLPSNTSRLLQQRHFLDKFLTLRQSNKLNNQITKQSVPPRFRGIPPLFKVNTSKPDQVHHRTLSRVLSLKPIAPSSKHRNSSIIQNNIQALRLAARSKQKMINTTKHNFNSNRTKQPIDNHNYQYRPRLLAALYNRQHINSSHQMKNNSYGIFMSSRINSLSKQRQLPHEKNNTSSKLLVSSNFSHPRSIHQGTMNLY